ncbi:ABC transporter substrate-binding protein, partial [Streptomyces sp. T21Q-yed]|uniref:ABC transporter substrate-binding protein n=1 Tax=Streptomyces sp. T21Q-yed TaxID=3018441 RepID=UPI0023DFB95F
LGVTEGLTALDANGAAAPALAASWQRENDRTWLFTLREATFQDGSAVTPAAVATALTHAASAKPVPAALSGVALTAKAEGGTGLRITTEDPDPILPLRLSSPALAVFSGKAYGTQDKVDPVGKAEGGTGLRITTEDPDPILPLRLSSPALAVFSGKAYGTQDKVDPVGTATGPFELTKVMGTAAATLDRYDDYWGGRAQATGIDVRFVADGTARASALRTDQVDLAEAVPVAQAATLDKGTREATATTRTTSLLLNTEKGAFKDAGLRAAARQAVDTSAFAKGVYEGYADAGAGVYGPAVTWAAGKRTEPVGRAEPEKPEGTRITLATYDNRPELPEVAQVLKQQLEKAGFDVTLEVREYSRLESDALDGRFDAFVLARNTLVDTGDPVSVLASDYTCDGGYNIAQLCDKDVDRAVAKAEDTAGTAERQDAAMAAEARILGTDAVVPLVHQRIITGVATSVRGALLDPYERTLVGIGTRR